MRFRLPALVRVNCPKCQASNVPPHKVYVWQSADERGLHFECDQCAEHFPYYEVEPVPFGEVT